MANLFAVKSGGQRSGADSTRLDTRPPSCWSFAHAALLSRPFRSDVTMTPTSRGSRCEGRPMSANLAAEVASGRFARAVSGRSALHASDRLFADASIARGPAPLETVIDKSPTNSRVHAHDHRVPAPIYAVEKSLKPGSEPPSCDQKPSARPGVGSDGNREWAESRVAFTLTNVEREARNSALLPNRSRLKKKNRNLGREGPSQVH